MKQYVLGADFGTDSVRAVLVDTANGAELASAVSYYQRWKKGLYCQPAQNQFRQHPLDYIESLEDAVKRTLAELPGIDPAYVVAITVDTTGSTPVAVDQSGTPLALLTDFAENPNGMFILWKDHTAIAEAAEINQKARNWGGTDYTMYEGGIYSSEWFWAKIMHTVRSDESVEKAAYSWMEHCDWVTHLLIGGSDALSTKRSRCAAGHKAMWHESWDGLPSEAFLTHLEPKLAGLRDRLYTDTYTADEVAGNLSAEWAQRLGLHEGVVVSVGTFDAHAGAVGGEAEAYTLVKVMGTSTCDMLVAPMDEVQDKLVRGICGQVDGSIVPGMMGLEAGQSAFGDLLAWFKQVLSWPLQQILPTSQLLDEATKTALLEEMEDKIIAELSQAAAKIPVGQSGIVALDWVNGRRTPDADQSLKGAIMGLNMGSDAPGIFKALVEAICFGSKKIVDRFESEGIPIKAVVGMGGVAKKSAFVMQTLADVLNRPIKIARSEQAPALGAAMYAAVAAGIYPDVASASQAMGNGFDRIYHPITENAVLYEKLYAEYGRFGDFVERKV
ncbi:MAG TPA: ribulokinase [Haliscomenobacter sp.]|uniref:ribulokinase n=1 Tax=Haliscomenobacter sp. TaxID=2717303 RepID=UPI002CC55BAE|nr:ribulokinase [Haliscomenobacter sp.]HOY19414.1 ribulokinase [Haliscomenobacter sp.]